MDKVSYRVAIVFTCLYRKSTYTAQDNKLIIHLLLCSIKFIYFQVYFMPELTMPV